MNNYTFQSQLSQQEELKQRSNGVVEAIEREKSGLFGFDGILDLYRDKISRFELERKLDKLRQCSTYIEWRSYGEKWELHNANFCRQPDGCPVCAKRLQKNRVRRFKEPIIDASKHYRHAYFMTMTVKNEPDLRTALDDLMGGLKRFRRQGQKRGDSRDDGEWGKVKAGILSIETKRGSDSKDWHPHAHALIFTDKMIDYRANTHILFNDKSVRASKLSSDWNKATKGKSINIDCRPLFGKMVEKKGKKYFADVWSQSLEILKYNSKILDSFGRASGSDIATILCAGYARRKFNTYGAFRDPDSKFYCGPLEPYEAQVPEGFTGKPKIFTQAWWPKGDRYFGLYQHKVSRLPHYKKTIWRGLAGKIMGKFRARKYRILGIRNYFIKRDRMNDFDKALEMNEKRKMEHLRAAKEDLIDSYLSEAEIKTIFGNCQNKYDELKTRKQFVDIWYDGIRATGPPGVTNHKERPPVSLTGRLSERAQKMYL